MRDEKAVIVEAISPCKQGLSGFVGADRWFKFSGILHIRRIGEHEIKSAKRFTPAGLSPVPFCNRGACGKLVPPSIATRDLARSFERELAQLGPISTFSSNADRLISPSHAGESIAARPPTLAANKPLDLEA